jgi:hypothetical protein
VATALFAESTGRLVVEVRPADVAAFEAIVGPCHRLGTVTSDPVLRLCDGVSLTVQQCANAFTGGSA